MSNQKNTYVFNGTMTALEPLTVSIIGASTPTGHRLPRNGGQKAQAYWPATTIRGSLRHSAHQVALAKARTNPDESPFDLADHFLLAQGYDIVGNVVTDDPEVVDPISVSAIDDNPNLAVFGYWKRTSKLSVGNAYPPAEGEQTAYFGGGARGVMFERNPDLLEELDEGQRDRLEKILHEQRSASVDITTIKAKISEEKKRLRKASEDEKAAIFAEIDKLEAEISSRKDQKSEARESIRRPIDPYEAIRAGCEMQHRMTLKSATVQELGFLIATLAEFSRDPRMGGHLNHGNGLVSAQYEVKVWPAGEIAPVVIGSISFGPDGFEMTGDKLQEAFQKWSASSPKFTRPVIA